MALYIIPKLVVALLWGSISTTRVFLSETPIEVERFTAVVVFPTPPF
jgi:hypothetical protein